MKNFDLSVLPFAHLLTEAQANILAQNISLVHYAKGQSIHRADEECTGGIIVKKGSIRAYILSEQGKEVTLYRLYEGEMCMLSASCVLQSITFDVFVDATQDSECYVIRANDFANICAQNTALKLYAQDIVIERFSHVMWVMQQILFTSFDKRLAVFLFDEMVQTKSDTITLTHEEIAKYMGSAREVVSRMLKYFSKEGIVSLSRKDITIINKDKLRAMAQNL